MIFRQLCESLSCTCTYLLGCEETGKAILIDPVMFSWQRGLEIIHALGLTLSHIFDTHIHADHITSALNLKHAVGSKIAHAALDHLSCTDVGIIDNQPVSFGSLHLMPLHTPRTLNITLFICVVSVCSPAMPCSSTVADAPIFRTMVRSLCIKAFIRAFLLCQMNTCLSRA